MIEIIERYGGMDLDANAEDDYGALAEIVDGIQINSYRTTGKCPSDIHDNNNNIVGHYYGFNREGRMDSTNPSFCIAEVSVWPESVVSQQSCELPEMRYYRIIVFYQLDLPIFQDLFQFRLTGDTKVLSTTREGC